MVRKLKQDKTSFSDVSQIKSKILSDHSLGSDKDLHIDRRTDRQTCYYETTLYIVLI